MVIKCAKAQGFLMFQYASRSDEAILCLIKWMTDGKITREASGLTDRIREHAQMRFLVLKG
jgi:hypothetical protein